MLARQLGAPLLLLAFVAGCGGDDEESADRSASPPAQEQQSETAADLKDTSRKPEIPRPTGSPPRRLVVEDIVKGKGRVAKPGDTLTVNYVGVLFSTGSQFDASWDRGQPFTTRIPGQVIEGWNRGLLGMRRGGRRQLTIPPDLAYGAAGFPPNIGPNETLVFVIDLERLR
ncbi:MAG TPA: FKBP-type peptidyl-prolyl cis-trans isomerase [Thermoleophilaceae bacterium]|nr:FKBP-type peptidyl-prolyl cis-trans isomerase [Thermoleophilaceae bacterium]